MKNVKRIENHDSSIVFGYYVLHDSKVFLTILKSNAPIPLSEIEEYIRPIVLVNFKLKDIYNFTHELYIGLNVDFFEMQDCLEEMEAILQGFTLEQING